MWPAHSRRRLRAQTPVRRSKSDDRRGASVACLALGVVWGTSFVFTHLAAQHFSAAQTTPLRVVFGLIPVVLFALATGAYRLWHLQHLQHFLVMSVSATALYYYAYAAGTYRLDSGVAGALSGSIPLFTFVVPVLMFRTEPFKGRKAVGLGVGVVGVVVLAQPWAADNDNASGVLFMMLGSASLGASFGYARRFVSPLDIPVAASATYQMVIAAVGLVLFTDLDGITAIADDTEALIAVVVGLGAVGTGLAFILYYMAVSGLGAVTASSASYIPPAVAMISGIGFLQEPATVANL
ncbi:DMT family transporter [Rhodococcus qingshengii]|uniref:DMT family transporter n=1 Tax=Rhodococcus qingshengii TaxID=334542 RepID=UPI0036D7E31F